MDIIFRIGLFTLPFENLFFAPSAGWATVTPIIFFIYALLNWRYIKNSLRTYGKIIAFIILILVPLSVVNYFILEDTHYSNIKDSFIIFVLGITNLFALDIYYNQKKNDIKKDVKIIIIAYSISLIIGIIQYITIKFNIQFLNGIFDFIFKRNYIHMGKVQFFFTEPSYIGMHLYGILLPIYILSKNKNVLKLLGIYVIIALIVSQSFKLILDTSFVFFTIIIIKNLKNPKIIFIIAISIPIFIICFGGLYENDSRVHSVIDNGIYADGSLASRYFRINAAINGYQKDPLHCIIGYGLGNSIIPIKDGYDKAYQEYNNVWTLEVDRIGRSDYTSDSESLSFYTKFISEFGIISFVLFIIYIVNLRKKCRDKDFKNYFWILLFLYLQFESYAFYTIWLYIVFLKIQERKRNESK